MKCDRDWLSTRQSRTRQAFVKQALLEPSLVRPLPFVWFTSYRTCTIRVFVFCQDDVNGSTAKFLECVLIYYAQKMARLEFPINPNLRVGRSTCVPQFFNCTFTFACQRSNLLGY
jgi:hypothetical protein